MVSINSTVVFIDSHINENPFNLFNDYNDLKFSSTVNKYV